MDNRLRELTVSWLDSNQINGAFDGFDEELIIFENLADEEIEWYLDHWVLEDLDLEEYDQETKDLIKEYLK